MLKLIRIPKGVALLAFFLPWLTVSCQQQKIMSGSGFDLAFGTFETAIPNAGDAPINIWLILAVLAIIAGLAATFWADKRAPMAALISSAAGLILTWIGTSRYSKSAIAEAAAERDASIDSMDQALLAMINVEWHFGFWLASLALVAATAMAWLVHSGKSGEAESRIRSAVAAGAGSIAAAASANRDDPPPS